MEYSNCIKMNEYIDVEIMNKGKLPRSYAKNCYKGS